MKHKKVLWIVCAVFLIISTILICNLIKKESTKSPKALLPANELMGEKLDYYTNKWYNEILSIMVSDLEFEDRDVVQEYSIVNSHSFLGIEYFGIKIFADGSGEMVNKFYNDEFLGKGKFTVNETFILKEEQVTKVVEVFQNNNFWEIPSKHPDEQLGLDGYTVYIEGVKGNQYNIISMWCPDDKYEIKKIYNEIKTFADAWEPISKK